MESGIAEIKGSDLLPFARVPTRVGRFAGPSP